MDIAVLFSAEFSPLSGNEIVLRIKVAGQEGVYCVMHCEVHAAHHEVAM